MKLYHVLVEPEDNWFIGRILERPGITTQGRSLDELVFMLRDAIGLMWNEKNVQLELVVPREAVTSFERASGKPKSRTPRPRKHAAVI